jgi:hypothetical protein
MNRVISGVLTGAMLLAIGATGLAGPRTPRINRRQENQQDRIQQGIKSGQLTRGEARRLEAAEGRIQANKLIDKSDGNVSPRERAQLNRELNRESRAIYRDKHNRYSR